MQWITDQLFGDLRHRLNKRVNHFEKQARQQERVIDMDINENRRRQIEAEAKLKRAQSENKRSDVNLYAKIVARTRIRERKLEEQKCGIRAQIELLRDRVTLAVSAKNVVELDGLMRKMDREMMDVVTLTKSINKISESESKAQVVADMLNDESMKNDSGTGGIDEEEEEIARVLMDTIPVRQPRPSSSSSVISSSSSSSSILSDAPMPMTIEDEAFQSRLQKLNR